MSEEPAEEGLSYGTGEEEIGSLTATIELKPVFHDVIVTIENQE